MTNSFSFSGGKKRARDRTLSSCITSLKSGNEGPTSGLMLVVLKTYTVHMDRTGSSIATDGPPISLIMCFFFNENFVFELRVVSKARWVMWKLILDIS